MSRRGERGFTLLEVMVALLVLGVAMGAAVEGVSRAASQTSYLRDRTIALWVAENVAAELRLEPQWPAIGFQEGQEDMLDRTWYWRAQVSGTPDPELRRANIAVRNDKDKQATPLTTLVVFLAPPQPEDRRRP
ncbi:MAG: type II secretion system minor pseudopilin GspI [Pseudomonadota bacterium]|nr:type II secretion system minor pseudopilin GspI [Pseudomonadota bacterium]